MQILMSIKPRFAEAIYAGAKRFEFRRRLPNVLAGTEVLIYETKPIGLVTGNFTIAEKLLLPIDELIAETIEFGGISEAELREYFCGVKLCGAIRIANASRLLDPRSLNLNWYGLKRPPQSWCYVPS